MLEWNVILDYEFRGDKLFCDSLQRDLVEVYIKNGNFNI